MTPETTSFGDAQLAVGKSYTDTGLGVTITTASVSSTGASVTVSFGGTGGGGTGGGGSGGGSTDSQPPTAPPSLTATALSSTSVRLSWFASTDNVGVTQYEVSRNGTVVTTLPASTRTFTDTALTGSTAYSYSVVALDAAGNRSLASTRTVTTRPAPDTTAPTAPTGLTASALSSYRIALSWQAATDNVGVTGYRIYRNGAQIRQQTTLTYTDRVFGTATYTYTVKAVDAAGNLSAASNAVSIRGTR
jgi:chitodextrinase